MYIIFGTQNPNNNTLICQLEKQKSMLFWVELGIFEIEFLDLNL